MNWIKIGQPLKRHVMVTPGKSVRATVYIQYAFDEEPVEGSLAWDAPEGEQAYYARFERGELLNLIIQVSAFWQDADATDILGACHIRSSDLDADVLQIVTDHGMVDTALRDLVGVIKNRSKVYSKFK